MNATVAVLEALRAGNLPKLERLLADGADPNGSDYQTALCLATLNGDTEAVDLLLRYGADPNRASVSSGDTPLHIAARSGDTVIAGQAIAAGAHINSQDACGWTPLYRAAEYEKRELARLLFRYGGRIAIEMAPLVTEFCRQVVEWERTRRALHYPGCLRTCRDQLAVRSAEPRAWEVRLNYIWDEICTMPSGGWVVHFYIPTWRDRLASFFRAPASIGDVAMTPAIVYQAMAWDETLIILVRPYQSLSILFFDQARCGPSASSHYHHMITGRLSSTLQAYREKVKQRMASGAGTWDDPWVIKLIDEVPGLV